MTSITTLPHRALIRVSGPDSIPFLKGLCTAHLDAMAADQVSGRFHSLYYGAFLRPQGKMICDVLLSPAAADDIWLDVPAGERDELVAKLKMYRLRAKVDIVTLDQPVSVAFGGPLPDGFNHDPRGEVIGESFGISYLPQTTNASLADWDMWRIRQGLSDPGRDFAHDELYPIDANLDLLGAIDFHKGCYVGQELTSRMKRRGQIKNRIMPLSTRTALPRDAEIMQGERRVGHVLTSVSSAALAVVRLDRMDGLAAKCDGMDIEFTPPHWLQIHIETSNTTGI